MFQRESGLLLHPNCLPSAYGIGELGPDARRWIEVLTQSKQSLWQVLPLTPPGTAASPYQGRSSFAGDVLLLSLDDLVTDGLLKEAELTSLRVTETRIDFDRVSRNKTPLLRRAAERYLARHATSQEFTSFCSTHADWLLDYARYQVLKDLHHDAPWFEWPVPLRKREPAAILELDKREAARIQLEMALQFLFDKQWGQIKQLAASRGVRIVGDLPIFVALDSADVWAEQQLFQLNSDGSPRVVAGVPPDYFSETGQRWGNPLYAWDEHIKENFAWWTRRLRRTLELTPVVRIDHFRGFAAYWEIPADEPTAIRGRWVEAPGYALFEHFQRVFGKDLPVIAEDLGIITDDVEELRDHFRLHSMRVLQFSFGGEEKLLPHLYPARSVAYTGTHDNDTVVGWYAGSLDTETPAAQEARLAERDLVRRYYHTDGTDIHATAMQALLNGQTDAVIFPLQDVLGLDSSHRVNTPGTVGPHNWTWRFRWEQVLESDLQRLKALTLAAGRNPQLSSDK